MVRPSISCTFEISKSLSGLVRVKLQEGGPTLLQKINEFEKKFGKRKLKFE